MSRILSTNGVSILSRYMTAMTAAITSTAASLPNKAPKNDQSKVARFSQLLRPEPKPNSGADSE